MSNHASAPPFVDGPPRFDVGLRPIAMNAWLLPDDQTYWLAQKNELIDTHAQTVFRAQDRSLLAQQEAAALIAQLTNQHLLPSNAPLLEAARWVSDDLVIMQDDGAGWFATACCLCSPTFFSASHAIGKTLPQLHDPVPDGDFNLSKRIGRVFSNLAPDTILERHNWTVQWSDARHTPDGAPLRELASSADTLCAAANLFLRVERQTIRKLPSTGAVLFTIRIRLNNLATLLDNPSYYDAFQDAWVSAPEHVRGYKEWAVLERHVAQLLKDKSFNAD
jgi:dimethylamine monooxygenase subunit A